MSKLMDKIFADAKALNKHIVLPEGEEQRVIDAAKIIAKKGIARLTLIGNPEKIGKIDGVNIVNPETSPKLKEYANTLYELRKDKGLSEEDALKFAKNPLFYGCLMIKNKDADGMVAGSINSTGDVLRPALQIIKTKKGIKTVSGCFIMEFPKGNPYEGVMIFADCAVIPDPTAEQLADIAEASAENAVNIAGIKEPKVALLSFSTMGSAKHPLVDKVKDALAILKAKNLPYDIDGELQADAAIVPSVGKLKAPNSKVAGLANVLVFPDLQSGNIAYKLVQRMAGAEAIGPFCQGLASPINDLSRGCSVEDIVSVVAVTALQK
ncbi:MAG: phosphate acetyltransferase [Firmicutes bacterium]|nr:phosphate acetyltransferase [Bacillota bacterium]